jgi:hypothetical protein
MERPYRSVSAAPLATDDGVRFVGRRPSAEDPSLSGKSWPSTVTDRLAFADKVHPSAIQPDADSIATLSPTDQKDGIISDSNNNSSPAMH